MSTHQTTAKRIANALLAAVLAIGLMVPTFALTSPTAVASEVTDSTDTDWYKSGSGNDLTIRVEVTDSDYSNSTSAYNPTSSARTYRAYQIFTGTIGGDNAAAPSLGTPIKWGASVGTYTENGNTYNTAAKIIEALGTSTLPAADGETGATNPFASNTTFTTALSKITYDSDDSDASATALAALLAQSPYNEQAQYAEALATIVWYYLDKQGDASTEYRQVSQGSLEANNAYYEYEFNDLVGGYYLTTEVSPSTETANTVRTKFILKVVGEVTQIAKDGEENGPDTPPVDKDRVEDMNGTANTSGNTVAIGQTVYYQIKSEVPDMTEFSTYKFILKDTLSKGLTFDSSQIQVKVGTKELTAQTGTDTTTTNMYKLTYTKPDGTAITDDYVGETLLTITLLDPKQYQSLYVDDDTEKTTNNAQDDIIVTYGATVNENAQAGTDPITNKVVLEYSNNPSSDSTGTNTSGPDPDENVYTTSLDLRKVLGDKDSSTPLSGATFRIYDDNGELVKVIVTSDTYVRDVSGTIEKTSSGRYILKSGVTSTTTLEPKEVMYFTLSGDTYTQVAEKPGSGTYYYLKASANDGSTTANDYVDASTVTGDPTETDYKFWQPLYSQSTATSGTTQTAQTVSDTSSEHNGDKYVEVTTGSVGTVKVSGLKAGTYYFEEWTAPDGYTKINGCVKVVISCEEKTYPTEHAKAGQKYADWSYSISNSTTDGMSTDDFNDMFAHGNNSTDDSEYLKLANATPGSLPITGGIGTTIFYIVGGLLVAGAVVYLVTRRRMKAERE